MLFVPEGAEGGLEVLLAVLLLPPAIPPFLQKSAKVSFPECCQFSSSSVGNKTTMQCNHNGQTGKPPSRLAPPSRQPACTLPASHFLLLFQMEGSRIFRIVLQIFQMVSTLLPSSGLFFSTGCACSLSGDHSSLQHRRLWEYQPLITPTHSPAQTTLAKSFAHIVMRTY